MKPMTVLDASALLAIALHEPGGDVVLEHIAASSSGVCIHAVNAFEVITKLRYRGLSRDDAMDVLKLGNIVRIDDINDELLETATRIKFSAPSLSMGDCFCIGLTEYVDGMCLTSDKGFKNADTSATINVFRK